MTRVDPERQAPATVYFNPITCAVVPIAGQGMHMGKRTHARAAEVAVLSLQGPVPWRPVRTHQAAETAAVGLLKGPAWVFRAHARTTIEIGCCRVAKGPCLGAPSSLQIPC